MGLEVPAAGGGGGTGIWTEDSNSPDSAAAATSITYTIADAYDLYLVQVKAVDQASSPGGVDLQLNGETGLTYTYWDYTGASTGSVSAIETVMSMISDDTVFGQFIITGEWVNQPVARGIGGQQLGSNAHMGRTTAATSPLTQFTFDRGVSADWTVQVFGRDIESP